MRQFGKGEDCGLPLLFAIFMLVAEEKAPNGVLSRFYWQNRSFLA